MAPTLWWFLFDINPLSKTSCRLINNNNWLLLSVFMRQQDYIKLMYQLEVNYPLYICGKHRWFLIIVLEIEKILKIVHPSAIFSKLCYQFDIDLTCMAKILATNKLPPFTPLSHTKCTCIPTILCFKKMSEKKNVRQSHRINFRIQFDKSEI
jgi:hypothetical protein